MKAWKLVGADHRSIWANGPGLENRRRELKKAGVDVPPATPLLYEVGEQVDGGPVGLAAFDRPDHHWIQRGAWRLGYPDARLVTIEFDAADVLERSSGNGTVLVRRCRVVASEPAIAEATPPA